MRERVDPAGRIIAVRQVVCKEWSDGGPALPLHLTTSRFDEVGLPMPWRTSSALGDLSVAHACPATQPSDAPLPGLGNFLLARAGIVGG